MAGLDKEADLVHMEVRTADGCECCGHGLGPGRSAAGLSPPPICILMAWEDEKPCAPLLPYPSLFPRVGERPPVPRETVH